MLQETWLYPDEFAKVSQISDKFQSFNVSSMSLDDKLLTGRPHGGLSILWNKSLSNSVKTTQYDESRIIGIEVQSNHFTLLFLTVYLPYECDMHYDDYCFYLSKLQCIIDSANTPYILILGDFNADIQSTSMFGAELIDFCDNNNLCFIDKEKLSPDSFTFVSQAHGTTSWLDHCITTTFGKSITSNISIIDDIVCSDHFPLCIEIVCDINKLCDVTSEIEQKEAIKWYAANDFDKQQYNIETEKLSSTITLPIDALLCEDTSCIKHRVDIDSFYAAIISALKLSAKCCIPSSAISSKCYIVPGWNEYVKEHHLHAKDALWWWNLYNRPRHGPIYDNMRKTRAHFKYALRFARQQEETAKADALARDLSDKNVDNFWKTVHKMNSNSTVQANVIDGTTGQDNIAEYWRQHFHKILNANDCDHSLKADIMEKFENIQHNPDMIVSTNCVSQVIAKLECGKAAGSDGICAEYLKFSHAKIHTLLALCFSVCISHGYLPADLSETTIVPIVKNKSGNLSDSNNYRPIALATIV